MELTELLLLGIIIAICTFGYSIYTYIRNIDDNMVDLNENIKLIVKGNDYNYQELEQIKRTLTNMDMRMIDEIHEKRGEPVEGWISR